MPSRAVNSVLSLVLTSVALVGILPSAFAADAKTGPLEIEVSLEGKSSLAGDTQIMVVLHNASERSIDLSARPGWDRDGGVELRIAQINGPTHVLSLQQEESTRSTVRASGRTAMPLPPGQSIGVFRTFKTTEAIKAPGTYRVVAVYRGPGNREVLSAPLEFTVTR